ncbi:MAG: hypothetical protein KDC87_01540 [Planctomycetes bacterium]|nr:hypothetical protein [Planctomycetota bacterium]
MPEFLLVCSALVAALLGLILSRRRQTRRLQAERAALASRLHDALHSATLGHLAIGLVHDINNLMDVVLGHADLTRAAANLTADQQLSLDEIDRAARTTGELARELLTLGRAPMDEQSSTDASVRIARIASMLERVMDNVQLALDLADGLPPARAKATQLDQVVLNLVLNAAHAMPDGGTVVVRTRSDAQACISIEVVDQGVGMSPEVVARAFDPFFTTESSAHTGIGLATVATVVDQLGGRISVGSTPGTGTSIRVDLPVANPNPGGSGDPDDRG